MIFSLQDGKHFYQWDRERVLLVKDSEIDQVHFTNDAITQAIVKDVYTVDGERLVDVPTALLQCACNLTAYAYKVETPEREYTLIHETFGVIARKKPNDYIPPEEHDKWETVRAEVLEALNQTKAAAAAAEVDKEQAATYAQNAKDGETNAADSEKNALESKNNAENAAHYAGLCLQGAEAASTSAQTAQAAAESARDEAVSAKESASSARLLIAQIANYAKDYKKESESWAAGTVEGAAVDETSDQYQNNSKYYAERSAESAEAASLSETAAGNSASAAAGSANAANSAASTAATKANEAAESASNAADSALYANAAKAAAEKARDEAQAIKIPTKVSDLENDSGYLTQHQDLTPYAKTTDLTAHTGNSTVHVTAEERTKWNQAVTDIGNLSEEIVNQQTVLKTYIDIQLGVIENGTY